MVYTTSGEMDQRIWELEQIKNDFDREFESNIPSVSKLLDLNKRIYKKLKSIQESQRI